ncbi:hypothetical protein BC834DRAFT_407692 [Gloeopeniophorella convolvens]|nr:hypothetical protein BC834DRAFT_407692 [Gloeopeniophorella convolvens]
MRSQHSVERLRDRRLAGGRRKGQLRAWRRAVTFKGCAFSDRWGGITRDRDKAHYGDQFGRSHLRPYRAHPSRTLRSRCDKRNPLGSSALALADKIIMMTAVDHSFVCERAAATPGSPQSEVDIDNLRVPVCRSQILTADQTDMTDMAAAGRIAREERSSRL